MLNKNDPLIAAVQKVMETNQAERNAVAVVNEKFGVTDRRALPRERQHEWDSAYAKVLTEGVESLDEKINMTQSQMANLDGNPKFTGNDLRHLRNKTHVKKAAAGTLEEKKMKDDPCWDTHEMVGMKKGKGGKPVPNCVPVKEQDYSATQPSTMGLKPDYAKPGTTPDYAKPTTQTVNRAEKTSMPAGTVKEENLDEKAPPGAKYERMVKHIKKRLSKGGLTKKEKSIAYGAAWKAKNKKLEEGFNNRHDSSVNASVEEQVVADQLNEAGINPALVARKPVRKINDTGVRKPISGMNNVQTRLANMRRSAPAFDPTRSRALDNPANQSNMTRAQNPNIGGAGGGNYAAAQTRIPMAQKRAGAGNFAPAPRNTARQDADLNAMRVASRDTNQDRQASAKYNSAPQMAPNVSQSAVDRMRQDRGKALGAAALSGPVSRVGKDRPGTGIGQGSGAMTRSGVSTVGRDRPGTGPGQGPGAPSGPENIRMATQKAADNFKFTEKERAGKVSAKRLRQFYQEKGLKSSGKTTQDLRTFMNAAKNKTLNTKVTPATELQKTNQAKLQAGRTTTTSSVAGGQQIAALPSGPAKSTTSTVGPANPTMAANAKAAGQMAVDRMKAQRAQSTGIDTTLQKGPDTSFNARHNYSSDKLSPGSDVRSPSNPERIANPTFVPDRNSPRKSAEVANDITSSLSNKQKPTFGGPR